MGDHGMGEDVCEAEVKQQGVSLVSPHQPHILSPHREALSPHSPQVNISLPALRPAAAHHAS